MDSKTKEVIDLSYKKLRASLMCLSIYKTGASGDSIWRGRAKVMTESLYSFYDSLPKTDKTSDVSDYLNLDTLSSYSLTRCFPRLREYLICLPGYSENNVEQNMTAHENHGFLTMQISEIMSSFEKFYIDETLKPFVIEKIGVKSFIKLYKDKLNLNNDPVRNLYFKNGVIDFFGSIGIISEDNVVTNYYIDEFEIERKDIFQFNFKPYEDTEVLPEERIRKVFDVLFEELTREQLIDIAKDNFDLLDVTDNIEEIKELIELNYAY